MRVKFTKQFRVEYARLSETDRDTIDDALRALSFFISESEFEFVQDDTDRPRRLPLKGVRKNSEDQHLLDQEITVNNISDFTHFLSNHSETLKSATYTIGIVRRIFTKNYGAIPLVVGFVGAIFFWGVLLFTAVPIGVPITAFTFLGIIALGVVLAVGAVVIAALFTAVVARIVSPRVQRASIHMQDEIAQIADSLTNVNAETQILSSDKILANLLENEEEFIADTDETCAEVENSQCKIIHLANLKSSQLIKIKSFSNNTKVLVLNNLDNEALKEVYRLLENNHNISSLWFINPVVGTVYAKELYNIPTIKSLTFGEMSKEKAKQIAGELECLKKEKSICLAVPVQFSPTQISNEVTTKIEDNERPSLTQCIADARLIEATFLYSLPDNNIKLVNVIQQELTDPSVLLFLPTKIFSTKLTAREYLAITKFVFSDNFECMSFYDNKLPQRVFDNLNIAIKKVKSTCSYEESKFLPDPADLAPTWISNISWAWTFELMLHRAIMAIMEEKVSRCFELLGLFKIEFSENREKGVVGRLIKNAMHRLNDDSLAECITVVSGLVKDDFISNSTRLLPNRLFLLEVIAVHVCGESDKKWGKSKTTLLSILEKDFLKEPNNQSLSDTIKLLKQTTTDKIEFTDDVVKSNPSNFGSPV